VNWIQWAKDKVTGKKPQVSRAQVMSARPLRNPSVEWTREKRDAEDPEAKPVVQLKIPRRSDKFGNVVAKIFRLPEFRKLELDEIGSDVWEMCDGTNSVEELTKGLVMQYRLNRRQAETSVTAYLRMLAERRLIVLRTGSEAKSSKGATTRTTPKKHKRA
jgi:hypothetical protein